MKDSSDRRRFTKRHIDREKTEKTAKIVKKRASGKSFFLLLRRRPEPVLWGHGVS